MDDKQLAKLLEKYLNGTSSAEEAALIHAWYEQKGEGRAFLNSLGEDGQRRLKEEMLKEVIQRTTYSKGAAKSMYSSLWLKISAAALVLLVIKLAYSAYFGTPDSINTLLAQKKVYNKGKNIVRQLLPDSSVVWLNPGASIEFPERFNAHSRDIFMNGECFFEVTKNPRRPFIVRSQHLVTKVWGTSFKITDDSDAGSAKVSVATGKVSVSLRGGLADQVGAILHKDEVLLHTADQANFDKSINKLYTNRKTDISALNRYKHINLAFENSTLKNMAAVLSRNFNVEVRIENEKLAARTMDADLTELNLPEVLEVLKSSMPLNYEISGNRVLLKPIN